MATSPMQVFQAFGQGMMSGGDSWQDVIADDVTFTGPVDQVKGKAAFVELNKQFMPAVRGSKIHQAIESGDFVITQVAMDIATPSGKSITLDMSEWYEIKNGKIQSVKIYYDAEEFRKEW